MLNIAFIGYFVIFVLSKSNAQNCIYAPACPNFVTWMPGYICDDGFFPTIKKKLVNGVKVKTVCCSEISTCSSPQFWCPQQQLFAGSSQSAAALAPSCSVGCVTQWKTYENDSAPMIDGLSAGFYTSGVESFIGRVRVVNGYLPGRIHANQPGMFYAYSGLERYANGSVEFLYSNPNYTYQWISSENGSTVANALTLNVPKSSAQYIGRISVNGGTFIGTVVRILGGMFYSDYSGVEQFATNYEVLVCNKPAVSAVLDSPPICPIYWKSTPSQLSLTTPSPVTLPMIINAQNGILTGDLIHTYSWANLANLTANLITDVTPASLIMPGGLEYSVGRILTDGNMIIGTVDLNTGIMQYSDSEGTINNILCFEVLVCDSVPTSTVYPSDTSTINPSDTSTVNPSDTSTVNPSDTSTVNPSDSSTVNPSDTSTVNPSDTSTVNPSDTSTVNPSDTSTINPSDSSTVNPSDTSTVNPSDTSTVNPSDTSTVNPSDTSTVNPSDTSTINPSDTSTVNPSDTSTVNPSDTSTVNPSDTSTVNPSDTSTVNPSDTSTVNPSDSSTVNPSDTSTVNPSDTSTVNPSDISTVNPSDSSTVNPSDTSTVNPSDTSTVNPSDSSTVNPSDTSTVNPSDSSTVNPSDTSTINPSDSSTVNPSDTSTVNPSDTSTVNPSDTSTVNPSDTSTINPSDSSTVNPSDTSTVNPSDTSTVNPSDSSTVNPSDSSTVNPSDTSTVNPSDTSTINPSDSSTVNPSDTSTVNLSDTSTVNPSDTSTVNPSDTSTINPSDSSTVNPSDTSTVNPSDTSTVNPSDSTTTNPSGGSETSTNGLDSTTEQATTITDETTISDRSETTTQTISIDSTTSLETTTSISSENLVTDTSTTVISTSSIPPTILSTISGSSTTGTTDPPSPKTCIVTWQDYTGDEDISEVGVNAVLAGSSAGYVGQGNIYGNILPGRIVATPDESYCYYFGVEGCLTSFQYLENIHDYTYNWVNSHNGEYVEDAIMVQAFYIGRILSNSHLHLGTVVPSYGMVYYDNIEGAWHYSNNSYQVLTCDPNPEVILYDCSNKWAPYENNLQPLTNGVYTDDENSTFVGRTTENKDYVVGRVQVTSPSGLLHLTTSGSWSLDTVGAEYLLRNDTSSYQWIDSSYGQPVEHAVSIRKSSSFWPMYIGRVQHNSTYQYIGRVLPAQGLQFHDGNPVEDIITHYQVLTCTTTIPYDCGCKK